LASLNNRAAIAARALILEFSFPFPERIGLP
jgi:hypothetical protein